MVIFCKLAIYGIFSAKWEIFMCFNAKGSCPKHSKGKEGFPDFSDAPYYIRGVSINQDVCLSVCVHVTFNLELKIIL